MARKGPKQPGSRLRPSPISGVPPPVAHQFKPGQSGNPSGLTKDQAAAIAKARDILLRTAPAAARRQRKTVLKGEGDPTAKAAATDVLDRTLGKPPQEVNAQIVVKLERRMERMTTVIAAALENFPEAKKAVFDVLQQQLGPEESDGE